MASIVELLGWSVEGYQMTPKLIASSAANARRLFVEKGAFLTTPITRRGEMVRMGKIQKHRAYILSLVTLDIVYGVHLCLCIYVCFWAGVRAFVCVCVCASANANKRITRTHRTTLSERNLPCNWTLAYLRVG